MSVSGAGGDKPFVPVELSKQSHRSSRKDKADKLKAKINTNDPVPQKSHKISKKSTKKAREGKSFRERSEDLGFKYNKKLEKYQSLQDPNKVITKEEMEELVKIKDPALIPDVFSQVLTHLNAKEIATVRSVNQTWSHAAPTAAIMREIPLLQPYVKLLNLDPALLDPISNSKTLTELQTHLLALRERIVIIAKDLSVEERTQVVKLKPPLFFDKISALITIYKDIDASEKLDSWQKPSLISSCIGSLCKLGCFEKAIELAQSNKDDENLEIVCFHFSKAGKFPKAIELANTMTHPITKPDTFQMIVREAVKKHPFDFVIELAKSIQDENILLVLTKDLCQAKKFDQAKLMANLINLDGQLRVQALREVASAQKEG